MRIVTSRKEDGFVSVLQPAPRKRTGQGTMVVFKDPAPGRTGGGAERKV
jgi:hypothetical protein